MNFVLHLIFINVLLPVCKVYVVNVVKNSILLWLFELGKISISVSISKKKVKKYRANIVSKEKAGIAHAYPAITKSYSVVLRTRNARKRGHWVKVNNRYGLLIPACFLKSKELLDSLRYSNVV